MVSGKSVALLVTVILLVAAVIAFATLRTGPSPSATSTVPTTPESTLSQESNSMKGLTFSPMSYDSNGINDFFAKAKQAGSIVEWAGDWQEIGGPGAPATVAQLASQNDLKSMIVVQFFAQSTGQLLRPLNSTNEQHYVSITTSFVKQYKPDYLGVGIEVNVLYEKNVTSFDEFVSLYGQVYAAAKAASPGTAIFTIFQYEKMNGLNGGLYGGINDPTKAEWQLLGRFPQDVVAFTTYPGLVYQNPSDIPSDYYTRIASHTNISVGFTEVGWHSGNISGGWGSDETEQAAFISRFFTLGGSLNKAFAVWSFLYDQNTTVPFNSMGLFYANGTAKQSWQTWLAVH